MRAIRGSTRGTTSLLVCRDLAEIAQLCEGRRQPVPAHEGRDAGQLYVHPAGHARSAEAPAASEPRTIGLRVPDHTVAHALLAELDEPLLSSTCFCRATKRRSTTPKKSARGSNIRSI